MTDAIEMFCAACGKSFWIDRETYDEIAEKIGSSWEMDCPRCLCQQNGMRSRVNAVDQVPKGPSSLEKRFCRDFSCREGFKAAGAFPRRWKPL